MPRSLLRITQRVAQRFSEPGNWSRRAVAAAAAIALVAAGAFLLVPALASVPQRLSRGCDRWLALAAGFELLSAVGFVVVFKLIFGASMRWRQSSRAGLCVLGASTVLPAGGVLGSALGAWITRGEGGRKPTRSRAVAFVLITIAPNALAVGVLGVTLGLGWIRGPHAAALTFAPAAGAFILLAAVSSLPLWARRSFDGVREANALVRGRDWKLLGAVAYYAFDNAALWAAFHAFGHSPAFGVIAMAYVIGGLGSALPLPGGIGGTEAGLIGALVIYGTPAPPAAAAVLVYRAVSLAVPVLLGAGAFLVSTKPLRTRARSSPESDPPPTHPVPAI
jgi:uncharacterized membrane protein YbhN (UPF0104 family)